MASQRMSRRLLRSAATLAAAMVFYYFVPLGMTPGEFAELETRTDALYFTVATLGTVGYGDVHPVGQMARIFATAQIVFDLVFVAMLVSVFSNRVGRVVAARRVSGGD